MLAGPTRGLSALSATAPLNGAKWATAYLTCSAPARLHLRAVVPIDKDSLPAGLPAGRSVGVGRESAPAAAPSPVQAQAPEDIHGSRRLPWQLGRCHRRRQVGQQPNGERRWGPGVTFDLRTQLCRSRDSERRESSTSVESLARTVSGSKRRVSREDAPSAVCVMHVPCLCNVGSDRTMQL